MLKRFVSKSVVGTNILFSNRKGFNKTLININDKVNRFYCHLRREQLINNSYKDNPKVAPLLLRRESFIAKQLLLSNNKSNSSTHFTTISMAPISGTDSQYLEKLIDGNRVVILSKSSCPSCQKVKSLFEELNIVPVVHELDQLKNGAEIQEAITSKAGRTSLPQVFVNGQHIGGCEDTYKARDDGTLEKLLEGHGYDYDLIVIGGGSGGLAASKEAVKYGKKVALLDFVTPTPIGTTWGLGGTCVNVGCIPKKLMHNSALIGQELKDAYYFGWETIDQQPFELNKTIAHNWVRMKDEIQNCIRGLNFGYRVQLREEKVDYINAYGSFVDPHKIKLTDKKGQESFLTSQRFIIATGERPRYPTEVIGAKEFSITSDDLFSLPYCPGKTLVVGASYVALECAGFLRGIGLDVTVMVRSILLRGFDQEMAEKVGDYMEHEGVKFLRPCVPLKIEQIESGQPGRLRVTARKTDNNEEVVEEYNTVLFAMGRDSCTDNIGLENTGVIKEKSGKIRVINEQTNIPHIYAIGDILEGKPELTPVAIEAGVLLAKRLYANSSVQCDYVNVPTTVFTPLEYGACGYTEEAAIAEFGEDNIEVYISYFVPAEWRMSYYYRLHRPLNKCYAKLICLKSENERLLGFHYLGPNAGEVTQLIGLPLKMKATKADIDALIGIHPTCAEIFTTLTVTKRSGLSAEQKGCCG